MLPNHYETLGLSRSSSNEDIKKAFRELALRWHPDVCANENAHEIFIKINEAYLLLYDEKAKELYDIEYDKVYQSGINKDFTEVKDSDAAGEKTKYNDPDLNNWSKNARKQAKEHASMPFSEFSKFFGDVVKESSIIGITAVIYGVAGSVGASGFFLLINGLKYGDLPQIFLSILLISLSAIGFNITSKRF